MDAPFGVVPPETLRGMAGLDVLRAVAEGRLPGSPIAGLIGFRLVEAAPGRAVFEGTPGERHLNPMGGVHGGYAATLLDSCMGCAVHTVLTAGQSYTTLELKVSYVRGMTAATGPVRAEGSVLNAGRRAAFAEGRLLDASGRLMAHGTTTCMVFGPG